MSTTTVKAARALWKHPSETFTGLAAVNIGLIVGGLGPVAAAVDVVAFGVLTTPAWVGAATWVGAARTMTATARAHHAEIAGLAGSQRLSYLHAAWRSWRGSDIREARKAWRALAESDPKFPSGTRLHSVEQTPTGRVLHVSRPGLFAGELKKWEGPIAAWFTAGGATVNVRSTAGGNAATCAIALKEKDPFSAFPDRLIWPGYREMAGRGKYAHSALDPFPIGQGPTGETDRIAIKPGRSHRVIGASRSGKGNYVLEEVIWCLYSRDAWVYVIDLEGADFDLIAHGCRAHTSRTRPGLSVDDVMDQLIADAEPRLATLQGDKNVTISPTMPLLHILIDGYHRLTKGQWEKVHTMVAEFGKLGVHVTLLDQVAAGKKVTARPDTLNLCAVRVIFTISKANDFQQLTDRWPTDDELGLPRGRAIIEGDGPTRQLQTGWAGDGNNDPTDPYRKWSKGVVKHDQRWTGLTIQTVQNTTSEPIRPTPALISFNPSAKDAAVWAVISSAEGGWVRQAAIVKATGLARNTVLSRLKSLHEAGAVERGESGRDTVWRQAGE